MFTLNKQAFFLNTLKRLGWIFRLTFLVWLKSDIIQSCISSKQRKTLLTYIILDNFGPTVNFAIPKRLFFFHL